MKGSGTALPTGGGKWPWIHPVLCTMELMQYEVLMAPPNPPTANSSMLSSTDDTRGSPQGSLPSKLNRPVAPRLRPAISSEATIVNAVTKLGNRMPRVLNVCTSFQPDEMPGSMN